MRTYHQNYWRKGVMSKADKELLSGNSTEAMEARKFADWNFAMGTDKSPLDKSSLDLVWGTGHNYLSERYGALVDRYPSTKEVYKQLLQPNSQHVWKKRMEDKRFPRITHLVQRWRKHCPACEFKEVLESPSTSCEAPDCQDFAPKAAQGPEKVRVCSPGTGCHFVEGPALRPKDSLQDQVLKGQEAGEADPFGVFNELGDSREPANAVLGARHEDHRCVCARVCPCVRASASVCVYFVCVSVSAGVFVCVYLCECVCKTVHVHVLNTYLCASVLVCMHMYYIPNCVRMGMHMYYLPCNPNLMRMRRSDINVQLNQNQPA